MKYLESTDKEHLQEISDMINLCLQNMVTGYEAVTYTSVIDNSCPAVFSTDENGEQIKTQDEVEATLYAIGIPKNDSRNPFQALTSDELEALQDRPSWVPEPVKTEMEEIVERYNEEIENNSFQTEFYTPQVEPEYDEFGNQIAVGVPVYQDFPDPVDFPTEENPPIEENL